MKNKCLEIIHPRNIPTQSEDQTTDHGNRSSGPKNGTCYDKFLYEAHIQSFMIFQFTL